MKLKNIKESIFSFIYELKKAKIGFIGLIFIIIFFILSIFENKISPFPDAGKRWRDIEYWDENPQSAAPTWINFFTKEKLSKTENLKLSQSFNGEKDTLIKNFEYNFNYSEAPKDFLIKIKTENRVMLSLFIKRPNGENIRLIRKMYKEDVLGEKKISLKNDAKDEIYKYLKKSGKDVSKDELRVLDEIFSENGDLLKGKYIISVELRRLKENSIIELENIKVLGSVSGLMGTDIYKRDLFSGIISGIKWALLIGLLTSFISVSVGVSYGIISAYFGGIVDNIMQRILEYFINIPFLPLLIVISAVFKPSIWTMIFMMCAFNWTGSVRVVRSMAMQIKEEDYIEASRTIGAGHFRIIFKHILPAIIPYTFAIMALAVPSAILTEAAISVLGFGDTTIVTWGQILQDAMKSGAVIQGIWWWIVPPGIMISLVGMSFAFIGFAMDKILMPKLKTR